MFCVCILILYEALHRAFDLVNRAVQSIQAHLRVPFSKPVSPDPHLKGGEVLLTVPWLQRPAPTSQLHAGTHSNAPV